MGALGTHWALGTSCALDQGSQDGGGGNAGPLAQGRYSGPWNPEGWPDQHLSETCPSPIAGTRPGLGEPPPSCPINPAGWTQLILLQLRGSED